MRQQIQNIMKTLDMTQRQTKQLNGQVMSLEQHKDITINYYVLRVKKLSLQSLDLFNEMHKQVSLLNNETKNFEIKEKSRRK